MKKVDNLQALCKSSTSNYLLYFAVLSNTYELTFLDRKGVVFDNGHPHRDHTA